MARAVITSRGATKADVMFGLRNENGEEINALDKIVEDGPGAAFAMGYTGAVADIISAYEDLAVAEIEEADVAKKLADASKDSKSAALMYLANSDDLALKYSESLCKLLMDEDSFVRESAVNVFASLGGKAAPMADKVAAGLDKPDIRFKAAAALALGNIGEGAKKYVEKIAPLLADSSEDTSQLIHKVAGIEKKSPPTMRIPACAAACALAKIDGEKYCGKIAGLLSSNSAEVKMSAAAALGDAGSNKYEDTLCALLDDSAPLIRATAASALGKIARAGGPEEKVAEKIAEGIVDESPLVKAACAGALGMMGDEGAAFSHSLHDLFQDQSKAVRAAAVQAMGGIGMKGQLYAAHVARMLGDPEPAVRAAAVMALPALGQRGAAFADECAELLYDQDESVRTSAIIALSKMGQAGRQCLAMAGVTPLAIQG